MFPLRKKSEKTGKQFSIFQKHLVVGFVCQVVSVCLYSTWCKESNRPMFEFKLCHFTGVFTWVMSLYLSKSVFSSKRVVMRIKDDLNKSVPGTEWAFKIIIFWNLIINNLNLTRDNLINKIMRTVINWNLCCS